MVKDKIPVGVKKWDADISYKIFKSVPKTDKNNQILQGLNISCHNVLWIAIAMMGLYTSPDALFFHHLLVGLICDIIYVAVIKAYARRVRPSYRNETDAKEGAKDGMLASLDKHSFPSGHASRAIYFATLISNYYLGDNSFASVIASFAIYAWALSVSASKVVSGKNHLLDIVAGVLLGKVNHFIQFTTGSPINSLIMLLIKNVVSADYDDYLR